MRLSKPWSWIILSLGCILMSSGCGRNSDAARSSHKRQAEPQVNVADTSRLVFDNSTFALELYQRLAVREGNLILSPYSLSTVLAMTYAGARGQTEQEMAKVLHFTLGQELLHSVFNAIDLGLAKRTQDAGQFQLVNANSVWAQKSYEFESAFLDILAEHYGAEVRLADFVTQAEASRVKINEWVRGKTFDRIPQLVGAGTLDQLTRMVLANAIYFKGKWKYPFEKELTGNEEFMLLNWSKVKVPMMAKNLMGSQHYDLFRYAEGEHYQALELPYRGDEIAMVIILPKEGYFKAFEVLLTGHLITGMVQAMTPRKVEVHLPKFQFETTPDLVPVLKAMGMTTAFTLGEADFSGIEPKRELFIQNILHRATVSVDEEGTEAAAASAVILSLCGEPDLVHFRAERPFFFAIRDVKTGTLLFVGRVVDPREGRPAVSTAEDPPVRSRVHPEYRPKNQVERWLRAADQIPRRHNPPMNLPHPK